MSFIAPLFIALSEFLTSGRPAKVVAEENGLKLPDLSGALKGVQQHSWHGKLAAALGEPNHRADLIPLLIHLARLERHHTDLVAQYDRAQDLTQQIRSQKDVVNLQDYIRAEAFTFKVEQAIGRVLRDIQKTETRLEKAQKAISESTETKPPKSGAAQSPRRDEPTKSIPLQDVPAPENASLPPPAADHQSPTPDFDDQAILIRHRDRIRNTPAKDRPALIARLIEQERSKRAQSVA